MPSLLIDREAMAIDNVVKKKNYGKIFVAMTRMSKMYWPQRQDAGRDMTLGSVYRDGLKYSSQVP